MMYSQKIAAILLKGRKIDSKFKHLWNDFDHNSPYYDVYAILNSKNDGTIPKDRYIFQTRERLEEIDLGAYDFKNADPLWFCCDIALAFAIHDGVAAPLLIMVEYDVAFRASGAEYIQRFLDQIISRLKSMSRAKPLMDTDFGAAGLQYGILPDYSDDPKIDWWGHRHAKKIFPEVHHMYFPFIAVSRKAAEVNWQRRRDENPDRDVTKSICGDLFLPSALAEAGLVCFDVNEIIPNSYTVPSMHLQDDLGQQHPRAVPLGAEFIKTAPTEMLHAVYSPEDYIDLGLERARASPQRLKELIKIIHANADLFEEKKYIYALIKAHQFLSKFETSDLDIKNYRDPMNRIKHKINNNFWRIDPCSYHEFFKFNIENLILTIPGQLNMHGWAVSNSGIEKIELSIDNKYFLEAELRQKRPDIARFLHFYTEAEFSGFSLSADLGDNIIGEHSLILRLFSKDGYCCIADRMITAVPAEFEFCIDEINLLTSGFVGVAGWAVSATGIEKIELRIDDGAPLEVECGLPRPDIARISPSYPDAGFSGFLISQRVGRRFSGKHTLKLTFITPDWRRFTEEREIEAELAIVKFFLDKVTMTPDGLIEATGWAVADEGIEKIELRIDGVDVGEVQTGYVRSDVEPGFPSFVMKSPSGFLFRAKLDLEPAAKHFFSFTITTKNGHEIVKEQTVEIE